MKKADIGLSLSKEEASLASDFTIQDAKIYSVIELIREGRCALCTSINCFKYMTLYSMIQYLAVTILYMFNSDFCDYQYIYVDVFILLPLAFFMNLSQPAIKLSIQQPLHNLIGLEVLLSVIGQICLVLIFQTFSIALLTTYSWYIPNTTLYTLEELSEDVLESYENNA